MLNENTILNQRYQILRVLSDQGGMGVIYLATDSNLGDTVIIKHSRFTDEHLRRVFPNYTASQLRQQAELLRQAFAREAKLLSRLHHAALPPVRDYFCVGDDQQFFVMTFIPGEDLGQLLAKRRENNEGPFPLKQVLDWAAQLLDVLAYLHTQFDPPIIHRDIKPSNLKHMPNGQIVLLDFGLAKGAAGEMSVVGSVLSGAGTPQYAPPEQLHRQGTSVRSDLYSLAVTLQHLLTGETPPSAVERILQTTSGNPDPLRPLHELRPEIPAAIAAILQSAAALNPNERPATAAEMRAALRHANLAELAPTIAKLPDQPAAPTITDQPVLPSASVSGAPDDQGAANQPAGTTGMKWEPPHLTPDYPSAETSTIERPRAQPAAPAAEPFKIDQPTKSPDSAQSHSNRWRYAAVGLVLAFVIGLAMFLNSNSPTPASASSEAKPLSLAPTPASTVADSSTPPASQTAALQSFTEDLGNGVKLEMVAIQGGTFLMGSDLFHDTKTLHTVTLSPFAIGRYEVTQAQWQAVMGNNPSPSYRKDNDLPISGISWHDAIEFLKHLSNKTSKTYRLPTEAEWEYACRAGSKGDLFFGDDIKLREQYAWLKGNSNNQMHPVGQKKPNAFGLYDMYGNVREWCSDWYDADYYKQSPQSNPQGPSSGTKRVVRGEHYFYPGAMSSARMDTEPHQRNDGYGLRVVMSVRNP